MSNIKINPTMNIDTIGTNAGSVWNALNEADALGLKQF